MVVVIVSTAWLATFFIATQENWQYGQESQMTSSNHPSRRAMILKSGLLTASAVWAGMSDVWAQGAKASNGKPLVIAQIVDTSQSQQDVSKDFLIGARAAWQDINLKGGIRGQKVTHLTVETDGTVASVQQAIGTAQNNADCVALSGSVGDRVATQVSQVSSRGGLTLAHAAPCYKAQTAT